MTSWASPPRPRTGSGKGSPSIGVWHAGSDFHSAGRTVAAQHPLLAAIGKELFG